MLFAATKMYFGLHNGREVWIEPNQKIPLEFLKAGADKELLERGLAVEIEHKAPEKPKGSAKTDTTIPSQWAFDPKELEKKTLDELNMMISNHVLKHKLAEVEAFEDKKEAIHWMSKDRAAK